MKRETLLAVAIASVVPLGYYLLVIPARTVRVDSGAAGPFIIGERKDALLSRLPDESYSPQPKPRECPRNWIKVAGMSEVERQCLISADSWIEGISYTRASCPPHVDIQTTLDFKDEKLVSVRQVCRRPE